MAAVAEEFDSRILREAAAQGRIHWHQHALERFLERGINRAEIISAIMNGKVIEVYPADLPHPSCLILHVEEGAGSFSGGGGSCRSNMPRDHCLPTGP